MEHWNLQRPLSILLLSNFGCRAIVAWIEEKQICDCATPYSTEAEFLDEIQKKGFHLANQSHLYSFALRFLFLQTHATSYSFYSALLYTVKEEGGKTWFGFCIGLLLSENRQQKQLLP